MEDSRATKEAKQALGIEIPKEFNILKLVSLKQGISNMRLGDENLYFDYINDLGHPSKGYIKFDDLTN